MSGSTPRAEDPSGPSLSPGPDPHPGPGDADDAGSGVQSDIGGGPATGPDQATAPDNRTEHAPDAPAGQQSTVGPDAPAGQQSTVGPDAPAGQQSTADPDAVPGPEAVPGYGFQPAPGALDYGVTPGLETQPGPSPAPGYGSQPGYPPPAGYAPQPGYATQPGYRPPAGYTPQPGYAPQPGYGYGPPGPGSAYPVPPARRRWRIWLGIIAGFMILAAVISSISVYLLSKSQQKWTLTAPPTLLGMSPDSSPTDQLGFNVLIAKFKSDLTRLPHYGSLKSTVSGIYRLSQRHAVGFIGFNGTFNVRVVLRTGAGLTVRNANPGPHGGIAECGTDGINTLCQWSTGTTVGIVVVIPTSLGAGPENRSTAHSLMLEIRDAVEHPVH